MKKVIFFVLMMNFVSCQDHSGADSGKPLGSGQTEWQVTHYDLSVRLDVAGENINGLLIMTAKAVENVNRVVLDLDNQMKVDSVWVENKFVSFDHKAGQISISGFDAVSMGDYFSVKVKYNGRPAEAVTPPWAGGFIRSKTSDGQLWIGTANQQEGADLWWPAKDHPGDRPDSMFIRLTVPKSLKAITNGQLIEVEDLGDEQTWHWKVSDPISAYNVSMNVGPFALIDTDFPSVSGDTFPVQFYVLPEDSLKGVNFMTEVHQQLHYFEELLGAYPFQKDKFAIVQTAYLGMEHQSINSYGANFDNTAMNGKDWGFDALHHHELAHEWWGNQLVNADWKDIWIHEGFATYMQALYAEKLHGKEAYHAYMASIRNSIRNESPVAPFESKTVKEIYGGDIYNKGAWILHSLRYLIGDEDFFAVLKQFVNPDSTVFPESRYVTTDDFIATVNQVTGKDLEWFFEVYLRDAGLPELEIRPDMQADGSERQLFRWRTRDNIEFPMPVDVIVGSDTIRVPANSVTVSFLDAPAGSFIVDPEQWVLRKE